jgi:hypothetical protein
MGLILTIDSGPRPGAFPLGVRAALGFGGRDRLEIGQISVPTFLGGSAGQGQAADKEALSDGGALRRLLWEIEKRTSIEVQPEAVLVHLGDDVELHRHPLLYWSGDGAFTLPSEDDLFRLRRHLTMGGMLILDSAEGRAGGGFDQSVHALVAKLFPSQPLTRLSEDHVLYRSFYLLRVPAGRVIAQPYLEAILIGGPSGRAAIVYSQNDLGGAWARDRFGQWLHEVVPGGEAQREQAFRLGVNLVMYALCLDYKSDQVHVPFIMRRRMLQAPIPQYKLNLDSPQPGIPPP